MVIYKWPPELYNSNSNALDYKLSEYQDKGVKKTNLLGNDSVCCGAEAQPEGDWRREYGQGILYKIYQELFIRVRPEIRPGSAPRGWQAT